MWHFLDDVPDSTGAGLAEERGPVTDLRVASVPTKHGFHLTLTSATGNSTVDITESMNILSGNPWPFLSPSREDKSFEAQPFKSNAPSLKTPRGWPLGGGWWDALWGVWAKFFVLSQALWGRGTTLSSALFLQNLPMYLAEVESWGTIKCAGCLPIIGARREE